MNKALVVLSGGMDSTTALRLSIEEYDDVEAISFAYNQKQIFELEMAKRTCENLHIEHKIINLSFLGDIAKSISTNISGSEIEMPTIYDVLGDPQPVTYVPNRNMIMLSIAASYAETRGINNIICGLQAHDEYGYWDTTQKFLMSINDVLNQNRTFKILVKAPFINMSKYDELKTVFNLDGNLDLYKNTLTCYNPDEKGSSCGKCPSCAERLKAFEKIGIQDPIEYQ